MKIAKLLELNEQVPAAIDCALRDNFGDAYLLQNNKIYAAVRSTALKAGFSFSSAVDTDYLALPLVQLENILQTKKIPYFNNVDVLKKIVSKNGVSAEWGDVESYLKKNFLFHESCHACVRSLYDNDRDQYPDHTLNMLI